MIVPRKMLELVEHYYEASPPHIPALVSLRGFASGHASRRIGARLSYAAGAHHCRICPRWWH
jgi:hypothetical protein